jgi:hypothetical protein
MPATSTGHRESDPVISENCARNRVGRPAAAAPPRIEENRSYSRRRCPRSISRGTRRNRCIADHAVVKAPGSRESVGFSLPCYPARGRARWPDRYLGAKPTIAAQALMDFAVASPHPAAPQLKHYENTRRLLGGGAALAAKAAPVEVTAACARLPPATGRDGVRRRHSLRGGCHCAICRRSAPANPGCTSQDHER